MSLLKKTFTDKDGSLSIPEVIASFGGVFGVFCPVWDWAHGAGRFDMQGFGIGLAALVAALGAAQRLRDGLWRADGNNQ